MLLFVVVRFTTGYTNRRHLHFILRKCHSIIDRWKETLFGHMLIEAACFQSVPYSTLEAGE